MKVFAHPPTTPVTGWTLIQDGHSVRTGLLDKNKSKLETDKRSFEMAKEIWKVIKKYNPEELVIENVQQQSNPSTMIILARLAGMIIGYAEAHNVQVHILLPSQWRKILGYSQGAKVKRQELKQQSINHVKEMYGLELSEDECEAICINEAAHKIYDFEDSWGE